MAECVYGLRVEAAGFQLPLAIVLRPVCNMSKPCSLRYDIDKIIYVKFIAVKIGNSASVKSMCFPNTVTLRANVFLN